MRVRQWPRDLGLAVLVVAAASFVQLAGQAPARRHVAVDLLGNFSPDNPTGRQWPRRGFVAHPIDSLVPGATGNILFTGNPQLSVVFGEITSVPNNVGGAAPITRFNPVGAIDEVAQPRAIAEGACWSGADTCQYVVDGMTCSVYERHAGTGAIQRVVGTGTCLPASGTPALLVNGTNRLQAQFGSIPSLGFTAADGLLIGSCGTNRTAVFRALPGQDTIEYVAGTGVAGVDLSGPATAAAIQCPSGPIIAALEPGQDETHVDGVAFAMATRSAVVHVTSGGQLQRLAGNGSPGFSGDAGPAPSAQLGQPFCVARHKSAYEICDAANGRIRRVNNLTGVITTVAGNGSSGPPVAGGFALNSSAGTVRALALDAAGNRYTVDVNSGQVGFYSSTTTAYSVVLPSIAELYLRPSAQAPGNESPIGQINGMARVDGPSGFEGLLLSDSSYPMVWFWNAVTDRLSVFAGGAPFSTNGTGGGSIGDGIPANQSFVFLPWDVARAPDGVTYIAETACRIRKVDTSGIITTAVGQLGNCTSAGDGGPASNASVAGVYGLAVAPDGRLFWAEPGSGTIRQLSVNGTVSRVAGNGTPGFRGDGGPALAAQLNAFSDIDLSPDGRFLFVSDWANHAIRAIDLSLDPPIIATIAGTGGVPGNSGDGGPANQATLRFTEGVSLSGNLLAIADQDNHRIRMVTFPRNASSLQDLGSGVITTVLGTGTPGRRGRGVLNGVDARVTLPLALAPLAGSERGWFFSEQAAFTVGKVLELGAPNAPPAFSVSVSGNFVRMGWTPPDVGAPAATYRVLARLAAGGPVIAQLDTTDPSLIVDSVPNGTYVLSVRGSNRFGDGPESSPRTITVPQPYVASGAPRNLSSSVVGTTVTLRWLPPDGAGLPTQYVVAPALTPGGAPITLIPIGAVADAAGDNPLALVTSFTASGVPPGTYYVRLYASNPGTPGLLSPPSNEVVVVVAPPNPPALNPATVNGRTVTLTWTPAAGPVATSFALTASLSPSGPTIASITTTTPALTVTDVPPGTYYVRVRSVNAVAPSLPSNEATVVVR